MIKLLICFHIFFVIVEGMVYTKDGRFRHLFIGIANAYSAVRLMMLGN